MNYYSERNGKREDSANYIITYCYHVSYIMPKNEGDGVLCERLLTYHFSNIIPVSSGPNPSNWGVSSVEPPVASQVQNVLLR